MEKDRNLTMSTTEPDTDLRLEVLCDILQDKEMRHELCNLQDSRAQAMIDYLYAVLSQPRLPRPWLRSHCLAALCELSQSSLLYPQSYILVDIEKPKADTSLRDMFTTAGPYFKAAPAGVKSKAFVKEAIIWGQFKHPNIVPFYGICYYDHEISLVSSKMANGDLDTHLRNHPFQPNTSLAYDVVAGLNYIHELGLVHNDLKTTNVLVDVFMRARITGFGKSFVYPDTMLGNVIMPEKTHIGESRWTAPELLAEDSLPTFASDIWALGCVLNQIMTGNIPFSGLSEVQVVAALTRKEKPGQPVSASDPVEKVVWEGIDRCFAIEARERPKARDILEQLGQAELLRWDDREFQDDNRRARDFLRHAQRNPEHPLALVNLAMADQVFKKPVGFVPSRRPLKMLSDILSNGEQWRDLCKLTGDKAQVIIDYLHSVLMHSELPNTWIRRNCLAVLSEVCVASQKCPHYYVLKESIEIGPTEESTLFSDMHRGRLGETQLSLKITRASASKTMILSEIISLCNREAILWGHLNHPNIVPFYGIYRPNNIRPRLCLVSPWMQNGNLIDYLSQHKSAPRPPFVYDVVSGLEYIHDVGIIHGDLRGVNILVNDQHQACITGFEVSSIQTETPVGPNNSIAHGHHTTRWTAPEVCEDPEDLRDGGSDVRKTFASDIWALGCVFYEILTGMVPFHEFATDVQVVRALSKGMTPTRQDAISDPMKVIWGLADQCWLREAAKRPKCPKIRLDLESAGLSRKSVDTVDDTERVQQRFRKAMGLGGECPQDLSDVKHILEGLKSAENEYATATDYQPDRATVFDTDLRLETLYDTLQSQELRHVLCNLQGDRAQVMIDYLYAVLSQSRPLGARLRSSCLVALYKLSSTSLRHPRSYVLKDVDIPEEDSYEVVGGFSNVYRIHGGNLCLKVAHTVTKDAKYMLKLCAKEATLWSQLSHSNIVPFYGLCDRDQKVYLVSPWMRRGDLGRFLRSGTSTPRAQLVYGVVAGLYYLHSQGIIHGNLKESNVLINDLGQACIADFRMSFVYPDTALATDIVSKETHEDSFRWTAPELLERDSIPTFASDIWALGCILNQIMTGNVPFFGYLEIQVMAALTRKEKPGQSVSTSNPVQEIVWTEIDRCFAIEARDRPDARDILGRLEQFGLSQGNGRKIQNDNEREKEGFLRHARRNPANPLGLVDLEEVDRTFRGLKTGVERALSDLLLEMLSDILSNSKQRQVLLNLRKDTPQAVIDYLYSVALMQPVLQGTWIRRYCLIALSKIHKGSEKYPNFYVLNKSTKIDWKGGKQTIRYYVHKGVLGEKQLCLKVVNYAGIPALPKITLEEISWRPLNHPNVVPFYGIYHLDDIHLCLVSPWMQNGNLVDYLSEHKSADRLPFVYDVISGLEYLEDTGVVHGDLKGVNILINDYHRACITDFGLSVFIPPVGFSAATVHDYALPWAAPELLRNNVRTSASDIWALGCVLAEILTGKVPFHECATDADVISALKSGEPPSRQGAISNPVEEVIWNVVVDCCWLADPAERANCHEIRLALESAGSPPDDGDTESGAEHQEHFREATGSGEEYPLDLNQVKYILSDLSPWRNK